MSKVNCELSGIYGGNSIYYSFYYFFCFTDQKPNFYQNIKSIDKLIYCSIIAYVSIFMKQFDVGITSFVRSGRQFDARICE